MAASKDKLREELANQASKFNANSSISSAAQYRLASAAADPSAYKSKLRATLKYLTADNDIARQKARNTLEKYGNSYWNDFQAYANSLADAQYKAMYGDDIAPNVVDGYDVRTNTDPTARGTGVTAYTTSGNTYNIDPGAWDNLDNVAYLYNESTGEGSGYEPLRSGSVFHNLGFFDENMNPVEGAIEMKNGYALRGESGDYSFQNLFDARAFRELINGYLNPKSIDQGKISANKLRAYFPDIDLSTKEGREYIEKYASRLDSTIKNWRLPEWTEEEQDELDALTRKLRSKSTSYGVYAKEAEDYDESADLNRYYELLAKKYDSGTSNGFFESHPADPTNTSYALDFLENFGLGAASGFQNVYNGVMQGITVGLPKLLGANEEDVQRFQEAYNDYVRVRLADKWTAARQERLMKKIGGHLGTTTFNQKNLTNVLNTVAYGVGQMAPTILYTMISGDTSSLANMFGISGLEYNAIAQTSSGISGFLARAAQTFETNTAAQSLLVMGAGVYGSEYNRMIDAGYSIDAAMAMGMAKMALEIATENIGDGNPWLDTPGYEDAISDGIMEAFGKHPAVAFFLQKQAGYLGESLEEYVSGVVEPFIEQLVSEGKITNVGGKIDEALISSIEDAVSGYLVSIALNGAYIALDSNNSIRNQYANYVNDLNKYNNDIPALDNVRTFDNSLEYSQAMDVPLAELAPLNQEIKTNRAMENAVQSMQNVEAEQQLGDMNKIERFLARNEGRVNNDVVYKDQYRSDEEIQQAAEKVVKESNIKPFSVAEMSEIVGEAAYNAYRTGEYENPEQFWASEYGQELIEAAKAQGVPEAEFKRQVETANNNATKLINSYNEAVSTEKSNEEQLNKAILSEKAHAMSVEEFAKDKEVKAALKALGRYGSQAAKIAYKEYSQGEILQRPAEPAKTESETTEEKKPEEKKAKTTSEEMDEDDIGGAQMQREAEAEEAAESEEATEETVEPYSKENFDSTFRVEVQDENTERIYDRDGKLIGTIEKEMDGKKGRYYVYIPGILDGGDGYATAQAAHEILYDTYTKDDGTRFAGVRESDGSVRPFRGSKEVDSSARQTLRQRQSEIAANDAEARRTAVKDGQEVTAGKGRGRKLKSTFKFHHDDVAGDYYKADFYTKDGRAAGSITYFPETGTYIAYNAVHKTSYYVDNLPLATELMTVKGFDGKQVSVTEAEANIAEQTPGESPRRATTIPDEVRNAIEAHQAETAEESVEEEAVSEEAEPEQIEELGEAPKPKKSGKRGRPRKRFSVETSYSKEEAAKRFAKNKKDLMSAEANPGISIPGGLPYKSSIGGAKETKTVYVLVYEDGKLEPSRSPVAQIQVWENGGVSYILYKNDGNGNYVRPRSPNYAANQVDSVDDAVQALNEIFSEYTEAYEKVQQTKSDVTDTKRAKSGTSKEVKRAQDEKARFQKSKQTYDDAVKRKTEAESDVEKMQEEVDADNAKKEAFKKEERELAGKKQNEKKLSKLKKDVADAEEALRNTQSDVDSARVSAEKGHKGSQERLEKANRKLDNAKTALEIYRKNLDEYITQHPFNEAEYEKAVAEHKENGDYGLPDAEAKKKKASLRRRKADLENAKRSLEGLEERFPNDYDERSNLNNFEGSADDPNSAYSKRLAELTKAVNDAEAAYRREESKLARLEEMLNAPIAPMSSTQTEQVEQEEGVPVLEASTPVEETAESNEETAAEEVPVLENEVEESEPETANEEARPDDVQLKKGDKYHYEVFSSKDADKAEKYVGVVEDFDGEVENPVEYDEDGNPKIVAEGEGYRIDFASDEDDGSSITYVNGKYYAYSAEADDFREFDRFDDSLRWIRSAANDHIEEAVQSEYEEYTGLIDTGEIKNDEYTARTKDQKKSVANKPNPKPSETTQNKNDTEKALRLAKGLAQDLVEAKKNVSSKKKLSKLDAGAIEKRLNDLAKARGIFVEVVGDGVYVGDEFLPFGDEEANNVAPSDEKEYNSYGIDVLGNGGANGQIETANQSAERRSGEAEASVDSVGFGDSGERGSVVGTREQVARRAKEITSSKGNYELTGNDAGDVYDEIKSSQKLSEHEPQDKSFRIAFKEYTGEIDERLERQASRLGIPVFYVDGPIYINANGKLLKSDSNGHQYSVGRNACIFIDLNKTSLIGARLALFYHETSHFFDRGGVSKNSTISKAFDRYKKAFGFSNDNPSGINKYIDLSKLDSLHQDHMLNVIKRMLNGPSYKGIQSVQYMSEIRAYMLDVVLRAYNQPNGYYNARYYIEEFADGLFQDTSSDGAKAAKREFIDAFDNLLGIIGQEAGYAEDVFEDAEQSDEVYDSDAGVFNAVDMSKYQKQAFQSDQVIDAINILTRNNNDARAMAKSTRDYFTRLIDIATKEGLTNLITPEDVKALKQSAKDLEKFTNQMGRLKTKYDDAIRAQNKLKKEQRDHIVSTMWTLAYMADKGTKTKYLDDNVKRDLLSFMSNTDFFKTTRMDADGNIIEGSVKGGKRVTQAINKFKAQKLETIKDSQNLSTISGDAEAIRSVIDGRQIKDLSLDELAEVNTRLDGIVKQIKEINKLRTFGERATLESTSEDIINEAHDGKVLGGFKEFGNTAATDLYATLKRIGGYNPNSVAYKLAETIQRQKRVAITNTMNLHKHLDEVTGGKTRIERIKNAKKFRDFNSVGKGHAITNIIFDNNNQMVPLSHAEAVSLVMTCEDAGTRAFERELTFLSRKGLADKTGLIDKYDKKIYVNRITQEQYEKLKASLNEYDLQMMQAMRSMLNEAKVMMNEYAKENLHREIAVSDMYFPTRVASDFNPVGGNSANLFRRTQFQERTHSTEPLIMLPMSMLANSYIKSVADVCALAPVLEDVNKIFNFRGGEGSTSRQIKKILGEKSVTNLVTYLQLLEGGQNEKNNIFDRVRSNVTRATLNSNLAVTIGQIPSIYASAKYVDYGSITKAMRKVVGSYKSIQKITDEIDKYAGGAHWGRRAGITYSALAEYGSQLLTGQWSSIAEADARTTAAIWEAVKNNVDKSGKYGKNAKGEPIHNQEYWNEVADTYNKILEETQPQYGPEYRNMIYNSGRLGRTSQMFTTQSARYLNGIYTAYNELQYYKKANAEYASAENENGLKEAKRKFGRTLSSTIVAQFMYCIVRAAMKGVMRKRDKDEKILPYLGTSLENLAVSSLANLILPGSGNIAELLVKSIDPHQKVGSFGSDVFSDLGFTALSNLVTDLAKVAETKDPLGTATQIANDVAKITGVPVNNIMNIVRAGIKQFRYRAESKDALRAYEGYLDEDTLVGEWIADELGLTADKATIPSLLDAYEEDDKRERAVDLTYNSMLSSSGELSNQKLYDQLYELYGTDDYDSAYSFATDILELDEKKTGKDHNIPSMLDDSISRNITSDLKDYFGDDKSKKEKKAIEKRLIPILGDLNDYKGAGDLKAKQFTAYTDTFSQYMDMDTFSDIVSEFESRAENIKGEGSSKKKAKALDSILAYHGVRASTLKRYDYVALCKLLGIGEAGWMQYYD